MKRDAQCGVVRHEPNRPDGRRWRQGGMRLREILDRIAIPGLAVAALSGVGGCTFVEQAEDAMAGGPQNRVEAAEQRQREALTERGRLTRARQTVMREQAAEEDSLMAMRKHLEVQEATLVRLRADQKIAEEEERRLHHRITSLEGEIRSLELVIRASRATGETEGAEHLEKRLQELRLQAEELEQEIQALEE